MTQLRLDRLLSNLGYGTRKEIHGLARAGRIVLDGAPVAKAESKVEVGPDLPARLKVSGAPVDPPQGLALMVHKPLGVTCSHREAGPLVYELLPSRWRRREPAISTVGRLDKETSGLLLMTDDGALLHRIISPKAKVDKRYRATLARPLKGDEAAIFASGTLLLEGEDKPLAPAALEVLSPTEALLTISEGRYHQVRRMFAAVGNHVEALHRDRVGGLELPADLEPGAWRIMTAEDVAKVFA
ncbi:MAG TPA: 16S rRNA pseudouridine(516) synthase [Caulobacteraceae bacterium]|nr:16S rRNA pseudouridine(516) synthase [Caulobacteraceae bacterium]